MLTKLKSLFEALTAPSAQGSDVSPLADAEKIQFAAAVLLVEVMMADHHVDESEIQRLLESLQRLFPITQEQSQELMQLATVKHEKLVSLHDMTQILNASKNQDLKKKLIFAMWSIALADENKDKYEEHLIRKVADLLYVSHADFIQARLRAETEYTERS